MDRQAQVEIRNVSIGFGQVKVLENMDLSIADSEFLVLLGPSGCGKSTLLNAIAGLLDVREGQIWIGGKNVTWEEPKDRGIAMVFQSYALYPRMSVRRNMSFGLKVSGLPAPEIEARVAQAARMLQIENLLDRKPGELSGGQRQRVAIGRALVRKVGVYLFDEPLSNLDAQLRAELRVEIKRLHSALGATMIYVTHDQIEALTLADRIAVMQAGVIQQLDTPRKIYHEPVNRFVASFVGSPAMNFIDGSLQQEGSSRRFVNDDFAMSLVDYRFLTKNAVASATLGIRPEHVTVHQSPGPGTLQARVEMIEPMGADSLVWCRLGKTTTFSLRQDDKTTIGVGDILPVTFPVQALSLFATTTGKRL